MTSLDSLALGPDTPAKIVLINPATEVAIRDKDGNEAYVMVLGTDSKAAKKHNSAMVTRQLEKRNKAKVTEEELEENRLGLLVALTTGWYLVNFEGEPIDYPFSPENARKLYSMPVFNWIKDLVDEGSGNRGNFMKPKSLPTSESGQASNFS